MRENVKIDLSKLIDETKSLKYRRDFGVHNPYLSNSNSLNPNLELVRVTDEGAKFLNLYGLFVDIESGDIALGMFPDPDDYYCVENIYSIISSKMFGSSKMPSYVDEKYVLECLKIGASYSKDSIYEAVISDYNESDGVDIKYDSVIMNIAESWNHRNKLPKELTTFDSNRSDSRYIYNIMDSCVQILQSLEKTATQFYGAFISEGSVKDVLDTLDESTLVVDLLNGSEPNLEKLTILYMGYGIPLDFLLALKSYGLGIKQRKMIYQGLKGLKANWKQSSRGQIMDYIDMLSSMRYLNDRDVNTDKIKVTCFNVIDLIRAVERENDLFFSIDLIIRFKNRSVFDSLESKFSINDIMLENKISEEEFVKCLRDYMINVYPMINNGSVYTRKVLSTQYSMASFSPYQIRNAGRTFERLNKMILKKI